MHASAGPAAYGGIFLIALATLMYEMLLTRLFSVTMWHHFAFAAISIAMFGLTVAGIVVSCWATRAIAQTGAHLTTASLLCAATVLGAGVVQLRLAVVPDGSPVSFVALGLVYLAAAVPCFFGGLVVCLALATFRREVGGLYAADLAGAALGCVVLIYTLELTDGPTGLLVVASVASGAAVLFARDAPARLRSVARIACVLLVASTVGHGVLAASGAPLLRVTAAKGQRGAPLYDRWNSFSRVTVTERTSFPFSWGTTALYRPRNPVEQLWLEIDGHAGTPLTRFDGGFERLEHLGYDVVNAAHYLKRDASVLVIGSGGGRDVLAALAFGQRSVVAVEMNSHILDAANGRFGEFTGRLDRHPRVRFVNDEARSYARREPGRFDIIQASLIDTFAATAAGAFVLAEHSLYTVEAWRTLLERLAPGGILTFGRWYHPPHLPIEAWRIVALARASLEARDAPDPRANIVLVRNLPPPGGYSAAAVLVKNEPFSPQELDRLDDVSARIGFEVMLSPRGARDPVLASLARGIPPEGVPLDLEAPTDDRPFFFHVVRLSDLLRHRDWFGEKARWTAEPVFVLAGLLALVAGFAVLCIAAPLVFASERPALRRAWLPGVACAALGIGFMFVEISQMQRLVVFLGHPTYALSVVLFSLLVSSGAGSLLVQRLGDEGFDVSVRRAWGSLVIALVVFGACAPFVVDALRGAATPVRIAAGVTMLAPIGFFMGMAFPITLRASAGGDASLVAWLWAVNGATSVVGAVAAVALAMTIGISTVFWCGVLAYVAAAFAFLRASEIRAANP